MQSLLNVREHRKIDSTPYYGKKSNARQEESKMKIICVDDERSALQNLCRIVRTFPETESLRLFSSPVQAAEYAGQSKIDVAFLDISMPECNGIELANRLHMLDENIRIIFVSAHDDYAMDAFRADAIGYVLKPYTAADLRREFEKAMRIQPKSMCDVSVSTIPDFVVKVRGSVAVFNRPKVEELFALLIDRGDAGLTCGEAVANLWPERNNDESAAALYRTTSKRLMEVLRELGISDIICTDGRRRYVDTQMVDCDLYKILAGDHTPLQNYHGEYMRKFSWAEERNAWLWHLDFEHNRE